MNPNTNITMNLTNPSTLNAAVRSLRWYRPGFHVPARRGSRCRTWFAEPDPEHGYWRRIAWASDAFWIAGRGNLNALISQGINTFKLSSNTLVEQRLTREQAEAMAAAYDAAEHPQAIVTLHTNGWDVSLAEAAAAAANAQLPTLPFELPPIMFTDRVTVWLFWGEFAMVYCSGQCTPEWRELWQQHEPELDRAGIRVSQNSVIWEVEVILVNDQNQLTPL